MKRYVKGDSWSSNDNEWSIANGTLYSYRGTSGNIVVPDEVKVINKGAFEFCEQLVSVILPEGLEIIYADAFYGCKNLRKIVLPNTLRIIGSNAFDACSSLEEIIIPPNVPMLNSETFIGCTNLRTVRFSDSSRLYAIDPGCFQFCVSLTSINIPDTVEYIGKYAFYGCKNLTDVKLPEIRISKTVFEDSGFSPSKKNKKIKVDLVDDTEDTRDEDQTIDEWYMGSAGESDNEDFSSKLEDLVRKNFDVSDYFEEPSVQGFLGSDYVNIELTNGHQYSFSFSWQEMQEAIYSDGPEAAANYYFNEIKDGIESGSASIDTPTL